MIFGSLVLPTVAIRTLPRRRSWSYAMQDVIEGPPRAQFMAPGTTESTLTLFLHASYCAPKQVLDALVAMADAADAYTLQAESGEVLGQYVITSVDDDPKRTLPDGTVIATTVTVALADPGLDGLSLPPSAPIATDATATNTVDEPIVVESTGVPEDVTPAEIARV